MKDIKIQELIEVHITYSILTWMTTKTSFDSNKWLVTGLEFRNHRKWFEFFQMNSNWVKLIGIIGKVVKRIIVRRVGNSVELIEKAGISSRNCSGNSSWKVERKALYKAFKNPPLNPLQSELRLFSQFALKIVFILPETYPGIFFAYPWYYPKYFGTYCPSMTWVLTI